MQDHEKAPLREESKNKIERRGPVADNSGRRDLLVAHILGNRDARTGEAI